MLNCIIRMFLFELLIWDLIGLSNILIIVSMAKDINWLIYSCAWMLSCKLWKALHVICISIYIQTLSVHFFIQTVKLLESSSIKVDKANWKRHHPWPKSTIIQAMLYASRWYPCCLQMRNWHCPGDRVSWWPEALS